MTLIQFKPGKRKYSSRCYLCGRNIARNKGYRYYSDKVFCENCGRYMQDDDIITIRDFR